MEELAKLIQQGSSTAPLTGGPIEGIARMLTAGVGGYLSNQERERAKAEQSKATEGFLDLLPGASSTDLASAITPEGAAAAAYRAENRGNPPPANTDTIDSAAAGRVTDAAGYRHMASSNLLPVAQKEHAWAMSEALEAQKRGAVTPEGFADPTGAPGTPASPGIPDPDLTGIARALQQPPAMPAGTGAPADPQTQAIARAMNPAGFNDKIRQLAMNPWTRDIGINLAGQVIARQFKEQEPFTLGEGQIRYGANGQVLARGPDKGDKAPDLIRSLQAAGIDPKSPQGQALIAEHFGKADNQLVEIFDANSPTGTRYVPRSQAVGQFGKMPTGMEVTTGPNGTTIRTGVRAKQENPSGLAQPTQNKVEEALLHTTERTRRVDAIADSYRSQYQQIAPRASALWTSMKEKMGFTPSEQDRQMLGEFSVFRRRAADDLTNTLKEMSGAAVTPQEAERLQKVIPNPGTGLLDGDSPTEFESKMVDLRRQLKFAEARLNYLRQNGFDISMRDRLPLERVPKLINDRGEALYKELEAQGLQGNELVQTVQTRLAREFGLTGP